MIDQGGRLDTTALAPATAASLDHVATRARGFLQTAATTLPGLPPIHFDFVDSWEFNAIAIWRDDRYFIGIHRGAVATLRVLFDRMLADPEFCPLSGIRKRRRQPCPCSVT